MKTTRPHSPPNETSEATDERHDAAVKLRDYPSEFNIDPSLPPSRSRMSLFSKNRASYNAAASEKREATHHKLRDLSTTLSLPGTKSQPKQSKKCPCATCGEYSPFRKQVECPLCHKQNHIKCLSRKITVNTEKAAANIDVCPPCAKELKAVREFEKFRESFANESRLDILYSVLEKFKANITKTLISFSSLVIACVENSNLATREQFLASKKDHDMLRALFTALHKAITKIPQMEFANKKEMVIAMNMGNAASEWIATHLEQMHALEAHLKSVKIENSAQPVLAQIETPITNVKPMRVTTVEPVTCTIGTMSYISITGENFDESAKVTIAGENCTVYFNDPTLLIALAPNLETEGAKHIVVTVGRQQFEICDLIVYLHPSPEPNATSTEAIVDETSTTEARQNFNY